MNLRDAVTAAGRAEVYAGVRAIYASLEADVAERRPVCDASGRCCRFEEFGHRLYITTAELALFAHDVGRRGRGDSGRVPGSPMSLPILGGCQYQVDGLCSVHEIRPFGCRIFFCDLAVGGTEKGGDGWMERTYDLYHRRLKQLHEELGVPYMYVEWRSALAELGLAGG